MRQPNTSLEELHAIRDAIAKASGQDLKQLAEAARARQQQSGREADRAASGQVFGTPIHHATLRALSGTQLPVAIPVIGEALLAALVLVAGTPSSFPEAVLRAGLRAVLTAVAVTVATDDEGVAAPRAVEFPPVQHQSSIRKLGAAAVSRQTPTVAVPTAPMEGPVPTSK